MEEDQRKRLTDARKLYRPGKLNTATPGHWHVFPLTSLMSGAIPGLSMQPTSARKGITGAGFHILHMDGPLVDRLRAGIDEDNQPGGSYHSARQLSKKDKGTLGFREYCEVRLLSNKRFAERKEAWSTYDPGTGREAARNGLAHPAITAFKEAFLTANAEVLRELFKDACHPFGKAHKEGRICGDIAAQAYNKSALPDFHLDNLPNVLALSVTLGEIWRHFMIKDAAGMITAAPMDKGTAYVSSPCLFQHGTWNPDMPVPAVQGGWRDGTLALHFRPLLTAAEAREVKDSPEYRKLLNNIQAAIAGGRFRLPSFWETTALQIETMRTEYREPTGGQ
jgi:hypothetical protein